MHFFNRQSGIPMDTNGVSLLVDTLRQSKEADFIQELFKKNEKKPVRSFDITFYYREDVISLNDYFGDYVDRIYPIELEITDTTDTDRPASYHDLHLEIDCEGRLERNFMIKEMILIFPL